MVIKSVLKKAQPFTTINPVRISVITPSFNNSEWLKRCVASVADQGPALREHIVQDACSSDGTRAWLSRDPRAKSFFEKDAGMYDAVNRGLARAQGEIVSYLNCDEQYLPGALQKVSEFFSRRPEVDVCLADTIIVDAEGKYLCHKLALVPGKLGIWVRFPVITAALFMRSATLQKKGLRFDARWKDYGDIFFVMELIRAGCRFGVLPQFTSIFTDTGENMNLKANAQKERREKESMTPSAVRLFYPWLFFVYLFRQLMRGAFTPKPFDYSLFTSGAAEIPGRTRFRASAPTTFWPGRSRWAGSKA